MKYIEEFESTENKLEFISLLKIRYNLKTSSAERTYYKVRQFLKINEIMKKSGVSKEKAKLLYNTDMAVTKKPVKKKKIEKPVIDIKQKIKEYDEQVKNNMLLERIPEIHNENERKPARLKMLEFENMIRLKWKVTEKFLALHGFSYEEIAWLKTNKRF